jgi:hypothetical protein
MKNILIILLLLTGNLYAQNFAEKLIADSLKKDANLVVRIDEGIFKVHSPTKCTFSTRIAYTILNQRADDYATKYIGYDNKFIFVKSFEAKLYDVNGKKVRELKNSDIKDQSAISDFSLHEDNRIKMATLTYHTYPYTVEFLVEMEYKSMLYISDWWFQDDNKVAVEKSTYQIITPTKLPIRYQEKNLTKQATIREENGNTIYTWEQNTIKPFIIEPLSKEIPFPHLKVATQQFEVDGHFVDMTTWEEFGKWRKKLCEGREEIPEATAQKIKDLVANIDSEEQKIRAIYEYMQLKTRYVSIQLGIGGWQPFPASFVDNKGFGDCKALSNYTKSLLKAANIDSHYTLVYAGDKIKPLDTKFPDMQFNHAILCVPLTTKKDTMWLECTSQQNPAGYMGDFTGNRQALLLTDEGGKIANTPIYNQSVNIQNRKATVILAADGSATAQINNTYQALSEEERHFYIGKSTEKQRQMLLETWQLPTFELGEMKLWREKKAIPCTHEEAKVSIGQLGTISGKRLFLAPNLLSKWNYLPQNTGNRTQEVDLKISFTELDTIQITLPENYVVETKLEPLLYKTIFGEYETSTKLEGNILTYYRRLVRYQGTFPKEKYIELINFYKKIMKADAAKVVLISKTY